jgi:hypothetical protein
MIIDYKIGDIVEIPNGKNRLGYIVDIRKTGTQIGVRYFRSRRVNGMPTDYIWWIHRSNVKIISAS